MSESTSEHAAAHEALFSRAQLAGMLAAAGLLMAMGSRYDYEISSAVLDASSPFGRLMATLGFLPVSVVVALVGALLPQACPQAAGRRQRRARLARCVILPACVAYSAFEASKYTALPIAALLAGSALLVGAVGWLAPRACAGADSRRLAAFIAFALLVVVGQLLVVHLGKIPWARPRMRMIVATGEVGFQPWWQVGNASRAELVAGGISPEEFKSFPSGHTAAAACSLVLVGLSTLGGTLRGRRGALLAGALAWTALVAASRVVVGAHFVTDVTAAFLVVLGLTLLAERLFLRGAHPAGAPGRPLAPPDVRPTTQGGR